MRLFSKVIPFPTRVAPLARFSSAEYPKLAHALGIHDGAHLSPAPEAETSSAWSDVLGGTLCR